MKFKQLGAHITSHTSTTGQVSLITSIASIIIISVMVFLIVLSVNSLKTSHSTLAGFADNELQLFSDVYEMHYAARERILLLHEIIHEKDPFVRDSKIQRIYRMGTLFSHARNRILLLDIEENERALLLQQAAFTKNSALVQKKIIELILDNKFSEASDLLIHEAIPSQNKVLNRLSALMRTELDEARNKTLDSETTYRKTNSILISSGLTGVLVSLLITIYVIVLTRKLFRHIVHTTEELKQSNQYLEFQKLAMDQHNIVSITDADGIITYTNDNFCDISGYSRDELIGRNHNIVNSHKHDKAFFSRLWDTIAHGEIWQGEITNRAKNGNEYTVSTTIVPFLDEQGAPYQYVSIRTDITPLKLAKDVLERSKQELELLVKERTSELTISNEQLQQEIENRKMLELELKKLANTDPLTGILNRRRFNEILDVELTRSIRYQQDVSIILFDIDNFKRINDNFGHPVGDEVIRSVVNIVSNNIRNVDTFCRWGGEEFLILAVECPHKCVQELAEKLRSILAEAPFKDVGSVTCSFGVTTCQSGDNSKSLLKRADDNLYKAKMLGRNRVETDALSRLSDLT